MKVQQLFTILKRPKCSVNLLSLLFGFFVFQPVLADSVLRASLVPHTEYVRSTECRECHQQIYQQWSKSHHRHSMQHASEKTVLGDFNQATFRYHGEVSTFYKNKGHFFINTQNPQGKKHDYRVKYTFGVSPLQQYLIALPRGRLQAFTVAWDVQKKRWFHLHPDKKMAANKRFHWSKQFYNWNSNCAECHSTDLKKNYNRESKSYDTKWAEINVACQACHGPGKNHVQWAQRRLAGNRSKIKNKGLLPQADTISSNRKIEQCASCHSRRHPVSPNDKFGERFHDHFMPALLRPDLYFPDGQIKDEVYVYGSFLQSKMYRAGVSCMDCHNPHSLKLRIAGNGLCTQCHNNKPVKRFSSLLIKTYNSATHTHHKPGTPGSQCVNCHMPERVYMQIDHRRDHSFRIPRPDLSLKIGVPNACNQCHNKQSATWAAAAIEKWFGKKHHPKHFAEVFAEAATGRENVEAGLIEMSHDKQQADIVRATAIDFLARYPGPKSVRTRIDALASNHILIRESALRSLAHLPIQARISVFLRYLSDPVRAVRVEAANGLAAVPPKSLPLAYRKAWRLAIKEYTNLLLSNADRPSGNLNLGNLYQMQRQPARAIKAYRSSIDLDKHFYPAYLNLATLLNTIGRNNEAEKVLREGIRQNPKQGELYYSLGLLLAEEKKPNQAVRLLARAATLIPHHARVQYNYALALQGIGDDKKAVAVLNAIHNKNPGDPDTLYALSRSYIKLKNWAMALNYAKKLSVLYPHSRKIRHLVRFLQTQQ